MKSKEKYFELNEARTLLYDAYWPPFTPALDYNPYEAIQCAKKINANAIRLGTIGKWALYPSKVMPQHPELNGRDLIGETIEYAKKESIKIVAYIPVGTGLPFKMIVEDKPEWAFYLDNDKVYSPDNYYCQLKHFGGLDVVPICTFGAFYLDIQKIVDEILDNYDVDAIYLDGPYQGWCNKDKVCQCKSCSADFLSDTNLTLPTNMEVANFANADENLRNRISTYYIWSKNKLIELLRIIKSKLIEKDLPIILNRTAANIMGTQLGLEILSAADGFLAESDQGAECFSLGDYLGKIVWNYTDQHSSWPRLTSPAKELDSAICAYKTLAMGGTPIVSYGGRFIVEDKFSAPIKDMFDFSESLKPYRVNTSAVKFACVFSVSEGAISHLTGDDTADPLDLEFISNTVSIFQDTFIDNHIQSTVLPDTFLDNYEAIKDFKLLCIYSELQLNEKQCENLRRFVDAGGSLFATGSVSYKSEINNFELADLFGVDIYKPEANELEFMTNQVWLEQPYDIYLELRDSSEENFILPQSEYLFIKPRFETKVLADTVAWSDKKLKFPCIVTNNYGKGKVMYVASKIENLYSEHKKAGIQELFNDLYSNCASELPPFEVISESKLFCNMTSSDKYLSLHIVNELKSVNANIVINVPEGKSPKRVFSILGKQIREEYFILEEGFIELNNYKIDLNVCIIVELD